MEAARRRCPFVRPPEGGAESQSKFEAAATEMALTAGLPGRPRESFINGNPFQMSRRVKTCPLVTAPEKKLALCGTWSRCLTRQRTQTCVAGCSDRGERRNAESGWTVWIYVWMLLSVMGILSFVSFDVTLIIRMKQYSGL